MRSLSIACASVLVMTPVADAAQPAASERTLVDPKQGKGGPLAAERNWSLRLRAAEPLTARETRALVALARPCSNWVRALRERDAAAGQRMFEQCMASAMRDSFDSIALIPSAGPSAAGVEAAALEAVMQIELECVGQLADEFDFLTQERFRRDLNSYHVAQRKVQHLRGCLKKRMARAGLEARADYHYAPSRVAPRNH